MFTFQVKPDEGEPFEIVATSRDIVLWEKIGKGNSLQKLNDNLSMTDMYSLAHVSGRRQGLVTNSLQEFCETVDIEPEQQESDETDPTSPGR